MTMPAGKPAFAIEIDGRKMSVHTPSGSFPVTGPDEAHAYLSGYLEGVNDFGDAVGRADRAALELAERLLEQLKPRHELDIDDLEIRTGT